MYRMSTVVLLLLTFSQAVLGVDDSAVQKRSLTSQSLSERQAAARDIQQQRNELVKSLIAIVEDTKEDSLLVESKQLAVELLGELRAPEAVDPLSKQLLYLPKFQLTWESIPTEAYYLCAFALSKIGEPAINRMLTTISTSDNAREREVAAWVIMEIEGKDQATFRLSRLIPQRSETAASRLKEAKQYIENYKPSFEPPVKQ